MAPFGLKLRENAFQTIPSISLFDAENIKNIEFLTNFERAFTPRGWLRSAPNFWENAFQTIPDFSSFDVEKKFWRKFLTKIFVDMGHHEPWWEGGRPDWWGGGRPAWWVGAARLLVGGRGPEHTFRNFRLLWGGECRGGETKPSHTGPQGVGG